MLEITRPTLLVDEIKCKRNLSRMAEKARRLGKVLVPHMKTAQSLAMGDWYKEVGVEQITVSSMRMAAYFAGGGWTDITVAFPVNVLEAKAINHLLGKGVDLKLFISNEESVKLLDEKLNAKAKVLIELDAGYNRTGVDAENLEKISTLAKAIQNSQHLELYGLYCHPGNTYHSNRHDEIRDIWARAIEKIIKVKQALLPDFPGLKVRMGDTPGCTVVEALDGVDELSAGNYIFYDLVMNYLNVCDESDIGIALAVPVVDKYPERGELIVHGGAVHLSKDHLFDQNEQKFFGEIVILEEEGWSPIIQGMRVKSLSQEHGIISATPEQLETIQVGDVLGVLPIHSCLTANLMKSYKTFDGRGLDHLENVE